MSEMSKELIRYGHKCSGLRTHQITPDLWQEIINLLYHAATWVNITEMSLRQEQTTIAELRRQLGDNDGRIAPKAGRGYSSSVKIDGRTRAGRALKVERVTEEA